MKERNKNLKFTDEELREALIRCNGQPTKAAELLEVDYSTVYLRVRKNPELLEVQKASRAKTFNDLNNVALGIALAGVISEPVTDDDGNVVEKEFKRSMVDYRTRVGVIQNLMSLFKGDEGIKDEVEITHSGSVPIETWLERNTKDDKDADGI